MNNILVPATVCDLIAAHAAHAPGEVEAALLDHPAVAQAVAFAVPDMRLGEDVATAVVAQPSAAPTENELRRFVSLRLADYKVPRRVLVLDEIPKGPTGKLQRIGLAEKLGLGAEQNRPVAAYARPANEIEELLADLWQAVLLRERVGRHDRFLDLGGDSLLATELVARVETAFQMELSILEFFDSPTVAEQAAQMEARMKG